jgi:hypothetical protein
MKLGLPMVARRFRNNAFALINAGLSFLNSVLYIKVFGVSATSDALYFAAAVIASFSLLPSFFMEQFLQYYNDYKHSDARKASIFLAFNMSNIFILGVILLIVFGSSQKLLLALLYPRLSAASLATLGSFLSVMKFQLVIVGFNGLLQNLSISYGLIKTVYTGRILNSTLIGIGQLCIIATLLGIESYPYLLVLGDACITLFLLIVNRRLVVQAVRDIGKIDRAFVKLQGKYFLDSFIMRLGHNLQGFFLPLVTSAFWSGFSGNMATCYGYANKFYSAIQSVIIGPSQMETQYLISNAVSKGEYGGIAKTIKDYLKLYLPVVLAASAFAALSIPFIIRVINSSIDTSSIRIIVICFIFLSFWLLVQCSEGPFVITIVAKNRGIVFIISNAVNIAIIAIIITALPTFFYSILIANILAQLASISIYYANVRGILHPVQATRIVAK